MSRWLIIFALISVAACATTSASGPTPKETPAVAAGEAETDEAKSEWRLTYVGTTMHTNERFECDFARVEGDQFGYACSAPGVERSSFVPLSETASDEITNVLDTIDWKSEGAESGVDSADQAVPRLVVERPEGRVEVAGADKMTPVLKQLEETLLTSVRAHQNELRSEPMARTDEEAGVCYEACGEDEWCEQVQCVNSAPTGTGTPATPRWNGPTTQCETVGAFPVCNALSPVGDSCERNAQCESDRCEGIVSPVCVTAS